MTLDMEISIKTVLLRELTKRQTRNSAYSLRAFARDLDIGTTTISDVLADKRNFSKSNLEKVMEKMMLSPMEKKTLWQNHSEKSQRSVDAQDERLILNEDAFHLIADWHYLAILNLAKIRSNKAAQASWIAKRLGISVAEVRCAIDRMLRMQLLKQMQMLRPKLKKN